MSLDLEKEQKPVWHWIYENVSWALYYRYLNESVFVLYVEERSTKILEDPMLRLRGAAREEN